MRLLCACAVIHALLPLQGCYMYAPLQTETPPSGETVEMSISDQGRVELSDRLGRGVSTIQARVRGIENGQYLLDVYSVAYVGGERSRWSGESMRLNRDHVFQTRARKLDKRRTWIAAGVTTVAVLGFMASRGLLTGFGIGSGPPDNGDPPISLTPRFRIDF